MKATTNKEEVQKGQSTKAKMYNNLPKDASSKDAKKFRGKRRRILFAYVNDIISSSLKKDEKSLKSNIIAFLKMYKSAYVLNDMSVESLYVGSNDVKKEDIKRMIALCQKQLATKKKATKKNK